MSCAICPRFHANGKSKCLGCGPNPHCQYCSTFRCCSIKKSLETCAECLDLPCDRINKLSDWKGFNTGKRWSYHIEEIRQNGLKKWEHRQIEKKKLLEYTLAQYNAGKSKNIICLSFLFFDINTIKDLLKRAKKEIKKSDIKGRANEFKTLIQNIGESKGIVLK